MFDTAIRLIMGDPCIGCEVRKQSFYPGYRTATDAYIDGVDFDVERHKAGQIVNTCRLALGGLELSTKERFAACEERLADPDVAVKVHTLMHEDLVSRQIQVPTSLE